MKKSEFSRISQLWKLEDPGKLVEALCGIINTMTMRVLQGLTSENGIKVISGDGIE